MPKAPALRKYAVAPVAGGPLTDPDAALEVVAWGSPFSMFPVFSANYWQHEDRGPAMSVMAPDGEAAIAKVRAALRTVARA